LDELYQKRVKEKEDKINKIKLIKELETTFSGTQGFYIY